MAAEQPTVFGPKATAQIAKTVREVSRRMMNQAPKRQRWHGRPAGGNGHHIWFTVISVACDPDTSAKTLTVEVTWYTGGCTAPVPGADSYGYVEVEDVCSILEFYTAEDLPTMTGRATYMFPRSGECVPKWLVDTICEGPECA